MTATLPRKQGLHACLIFDDPAEELRVMGRHLADGVAAGRRTLAFVERISTQELTSSLEREGVDVARQVALGALLIRRSRSTYVPNGSFDPAQMTGQVAELEREAARAGYRGLCAAGDMSWALAGDRGSDRLVEYEYRLQRTVFSRLNVVGLCQYDSSRFDAVTLRDIARAHPVHVATVRRTPALA